MRLLRYTLFICLAFAVLGNASAQVDETSETNVLDEITVDDAKKHLGYLASDELKGREAGTETGKKAAEYIASKFKEWNITPAGEKDTYFQTVPGLGKPEFDKDNNYLKIWTAGVDFEDPTTESVEFSKEYAPMGYVDSVELEESLVFIGYGITAPELKYDDYEDVETKGKIAIMFRYVPKYGEKDTKFVGSSYNHAYFQAKIMNAKRHGVKAILMMNPPGNDEGMMSPGRRGSVYPGNIPLIQITHKVGDKLLKDTGKNVEDLFKIIDATNMPKSFEIKFRKIQLKIKSTRSAGQNVLGKIEGSDEKLKSEYIVIGGHYDHIGMGYFGSRMGEKGRDKIHYGADDNASGAVGVMEIAKAYAKQTTRFKRTIIFALWDGEEKGLVGSSRFVSKPTIELKNVVAYINFDMIGRLREDKLHVLGARSSSGWEPLLKEINEGYKFDMSTGGSPYGGSDQASFARHEIPVAFFITGGHDDYHTPSDTADKINYEGLVKICKFNFKLIEKLAQSDEKLVTWTMSKGK